MISTVSQGYQAELNKFLKTVFNYMSGGVAISGLAAYWVMHSSIGAAIAYNPIFQIGFLIFWFAFGFFGHKAVESLSATGGLVLFGAFSALTGMAFTPTIMAHTAANITSAFFIASGLFAFMAMFGFNSKKSLAPWGGFLRMMGFGLIAAILVSIIMMFMGINVSAFSLMLSFLIVPFIAAGVAYELNMLKEQYHHYSHDEEMKAKMSILSAISLYTSFVVLFIHILNIISALSGRD
jgi:FtsH-binding integral membrane protein